MQNVPSAALKQELKLAGKEWAKSTNGSSSSVTISAKPRTGCYVSDHMNESASSFILSRETVDVCSKRVALALSSLCALWINPFCAFISGSYFGLWGNKDWQK